VLEHKSGMAGNISETCKDRGNVTMEAYRNSPTLFQTVYHPRPLRPPLPPRLGVRNPMHRKLQSLLSQERVKLYGFQIWPMHSYGSSAPSEQKTIKFLDKRELGCIQGLPKVFSTSIISGTGVMKGGMTVYLSNSMKVCNH